MVNLAGSVEHLKSLSNTLVKVGLSDECGCPEEESIIGQLYTIIHLEPDAGGHIFINCGDWDDEKLVECNTMEELQQYLSKHPGKSKLHSFFNMAYQGAKHLPLFYPATFLLGCFIGWVYSMLEAFMLTQANIAVDAYIQAIPFRQEPPF